ncbi:MAG: ABC transporter permease subunit [Pseudomonadota bacterium]|nr:ABC transporter permease subunit [Pseudomonadota bacterium]
MNTTLAIARREFRSYFSTPLAYVFIVIYLALSSWFTFYLGGLYERNQADLLPFFNYQPWLFLILIPSISMRLWAEERKTGSIELLMTLPISMWQAIIGKFFAAWLFTSIAIFLTFPLWLTVNYLGSPDNGAIFAGYIGCIFLAGAFLSIGSCISAANRNQVVAFIVTILVCLIFLLSGFPMVLDFFSGWAPKLILDAIAGLSFLSHFTSISKGVIDIRDIIYFVIIISGWLYANTLVLEIKKGT